MRVSDEGAVRHNEKYEGGSIRDSIAEDFQEISRCDAQSKGFMYRPRQMACLVVDVGYVSLQDFFDVSSVSARRLMDAWACPRTFPPSIGRGNRSSIFTRLSKVGGTGTSTTSWLG